MREAFAFPARTGGDPRRARVPTFAVAEAECFVQKRDTWRTESPAKNWRLAMDKYVLPKIGGVPVDWGASTQL